MQPAEEAHQQQHHQQIPSLGERESVQFDSVPMRCLVPRWCPMWIYKARRSPPLRSQTWEVAPNHMRVCLNFRLPLSPPRFAIRLLTWLKTSWGGAAEEKIVFVYSRCLQQLLRELNEEIQFHIKMFWEYQQIFFIIFRYRTKTAKHTPIFYFVHFLLTSQQGFLKYIVCI
jgi:hypothetical protein